VLGQTRLGVGTARHDKADLDKELIGDFLRNAAMRFGICLSLWSKTEWEDQPEGIRPAPKVDTDSAIKRFRDACTKEGLDAEKFANDSGVPFLQDATPEQIETLRTAFREYKSAALGSESAPKKAEESTKQQVSSFIDTVYAAFPTAETVSASPQIKDPTSQASKAQIGKIRAMLGGKGFNSYVDKLDKIKDLINKPDLKNIEHLSKGDANKVINMIEEMK
jgi:trans-2-enoyl-CoA reductase